MPKRERQSRHSLLTAGEDQEDRRAKTRKTVTSRKKSQMNLVVDHVQGRPHQIERYWRTDQTRLGSGARRLDLFHQADRRVRAPRPEGGRHGQVDGTNSPHWHHLEPNLVEKHVKRSSDLTGRAPLLRRPGQQRVSRCALHLQNSWAKSALQHEARGSFLQLRNL